MSNTKAIDQFSAQSGSTQRGAWTQIDTETQDNLKAIYQLIGLDRLEAINQAVTAYYFQILKAKENEQEFKKGERVLFKAREEWGYGVILTIRKIGPNRVCGQGEHQELTIGFDKNIGIKRVLYPPADIEKADS